MQEASESISFGREGLHLQNFSGPLLHNLTYIIGFPSLSPADWHPSGANWMKGGGWGNMQD
eukprot:1160808-Pelagomonas_calceolata.AAC.38